MRWVWTLISALILAIVLLSVAASFAVYLGVTLQNCPGSSSSAAASTATANTLFSTTAVSYSLGSTSNSSGGAASALPVPIVADPLSLAPLAGLSLVPHGNNSGDIAITDLASPAYWQQVHAAEYQTYEQLIPQTVMGFFNDSEAWRDWALQYIPSSPDWLTIGFATVAQGQVTAIEPPASNSGNGTENATAISLGVQNFAASAAGLTLASLDFVSFNGLTALKTYFETGNPLLAACQTLPGQLAQLYKSSFDSTIPENERAQYLGRALAITSLMLILGEKDHFSDEFQTAIDGLGLGDSWSTVKPYLGDITERVSASASSATFTILETLAQRFPQDAVWTTGLTADRVDCMVQVFKEDGLSNDFVQGDIQKVGQAASSSPTEDGAAAVADDLSYQDGQWLKVSVRSQNRLSLFQDSTGRTQAITTSWLQENVPGFNPQTENFIQISYREADVAVYNYYGGPSDTDDGVNPQDSTWSPTAPSDVAKPGMIATVQFSLLTPESFVDRMPQVYFDGADFDEPWMTPASELASYSLSGNDELRISVSQAGFAGISVSNFEFDGEDAVLNWDGKTTSLDFQVADVFGETTEMRLVYNGYDNPQLRLVTGQSDFAQVLLASSDGVALKFLYDTGPSKSSITTIYVKVPSVLWSISDEVQGDPQYLASGGSAVYQIDDVMPTRSLEANMINQGTTYDKGTLGAEIAYTVGTETLGLQNLILHEPSEGGTDLNTADKTTFMQARMLDLSKVNPDGIPSEIQEQLPQMIGKINQDFKNNKTTATMGYVIISYIDNQHLVHTIIVQVPNQ